MISENFARCLAKICGDGNLSQRYLRYCNTCPDLLDEFKEDMRAEFGEVHFIEGKVNSGTSFVQIQNRHVLSAFSSQMKSFKSRDIFMPVSVKNSYSEVQLAFIRAFYDDEGCAALRLNKSTQEWKRNITLCSNSVQILKEIKEILLSLEIFTNKIYRNEKKSNYDSSFILSITGKRNFLLFKEKIGFKHPRKAALLKLIVKSYDATPKRKPYLYKKLKKKKMNLAFPFE
jgi:hypothetical protein